MRGTLSILALLLSDDIEQEIRASLDDVPKSAFGLSQAEREACEKRLERELATVEQEIEQLERAWVAEVGDGIPCLI